MFLVYVGKKQHTTVVNKRLSKIYRFENGKPVYVNSLTDRIELMRYVERSKAGCCGGAKREKPIIPDKLYCIYKKLNLEEYRREWAKKLNLLNKVL